ncbi:serine/threonine protein kinase [Vibrio sp. 03-59-1]|uniref:serine/threonine protein kinase n=1 Tax=Vibrio sp. 03-59-1 TaxID=2607607 RepID=UPI0014933E8E|nr:serine/threonine protein kinase [Vibrio sp. 03-59-1]
MQLGSSSTQVFYNLLDLDEVEREKQLFTLKIHQPNLYRQLQPLLKTVTSEPLTQLLGFHAQQAIKQEFNFSDQIIGKYQLRQEIGRGGMGIVYAAERADHTFEQQLAIKFIQAGLTDILGRRALFDEAQLLARLNHPYVAKVFDGGEHQDYLYIIMERVIGDTLNAHLERNKLSKKRKLLLFTQICQAIEHAHQQHILHADLKPENILVDSDGNPKLLDFNITQKVATNDSHSDLLLAYSEHYASPEQMAGDYLTNQSDVYSLGKILSLMFPDEHPRSDVFCIIQKATQEQPEQRYKSVEKLRYDIKNILTHQPISIKQNMPFYSTLRLFQRKPIQMMLGGLLIISAAAFSITLIQKNHQLEQEKQVAEEMMFEVASLMFHSKGDVNAQMSVQTMLELTRRRILANPNLPQHIKQKMLLAMMTPVPKKSSLNCAPNCTKK